MPNIYYDPNYYGLGIVGVIEWCEDEYQFDLTVVWVDANGDLFYGSDSGCSCPVPFEDATVDDDLTGITRPGVFIDYTSNRLSGMEVPAQELERLKGAIGELTQKVRILWRDGQRAGE